MDLALPPRRLPNFIIVGTMKSGTTTLWRWLEDQPELALSPTKEPHFFSREWGRGVDWYTGLFAGAPPERLVGEASASYTSPEHAAVVVDRITELLPEVRLICLLRHPIERLRSHVRHEIQRGRERDTLTAAVTRPGNPYVGHSLYGRCLGPYLDRFAPERLCVVRFEDLVGEGAPAWPVILRHLGLVERAAPATVHNVTADKVQFSAPLLFLWERGLLRGIDHLPRSIRRVGKRVLTRSGRGYDEQLSGASGPLPTAVEAAIWEDTDRLTSRLGWKPWGGRDGG